MRESYSCLRCPSCGANKIVCEGNGLRCEYCDKKFNSELDEVVIDKTDKASLEDLKTFYCEKIEELEIKKFRDKKFLATYSKKETQRGLECASYIVLAISVLSVFSVFTVPFMAILSILGFVFFTFARKKRKKIYNKYHPLVVEHAKKVAEYEEMKNKYMRILSKLSD